MNHDFFRDGSGRVARMLANLMALQADKEGCSHATNKGILLLFGIVSPSYL